MASRTLPTECEHGVVCDFGDSGPDPDDGTVGVEPCVHCEDEKPYVASVLVEWWPSASIGETDAVRHLIEGWCGVLMERLLELGVVDPTVELDVNERAEALHPGALIHDPEAAVRAIATAFMRRRRTAYSDEGLARYIVTLLTLPSGTEPKEQDPDA